MIRSQRVRVFVLTAVSVCAVGVTAYGQTTYTVAASNGSQTTVAADEVEAMSQQIRSELQKKQISPMVADPSITNVAAAGLNQVGLEVSKEGTTIGKARLSFPLNGPKTSVDVVIKGTVNSASEGIPFSNLGLSNGASARLGVHHTLWADVTAAEAGNVTVGSHQVAGLKSAAAKAIASRTTAQRMVEAGEISATSAVFVDAAYEHGRNQFDYLRTPDSTVQHESHPSDFVSFSVGYGRTGQFSGVDAPQPLFYAGFTFTGGTQYQGTSPRQVCLPIANTTALQCSSLALGAPASDSTQELKAELRQWVRDQKIGFNPYFIGDHDDSGWTRRAAIDISSLAFTKADGSSSYQLDTTALSVGIRVGYVFDGAQKGPEFAVFFSTVLGIW